MLNQMTSEVLEAIRGKDSLFHSRESQEVFEFLRMASNFLSFVYLKCFSSQKQAVFGVQTRCIGVPAVSVFVS